MPYQILVVDDEPDMESLVRQKLRRQVQSKEFEFFFSHNGEEALQTLAEQPGIDLVLTDINMPVMDGLTLLGRLNDSSKTVKTVIVSAYGDMANIRTAMNRGAIDFLIKPIDFDDFEITVRKGLAQIARLRKSMESQDELAALQRELSIAARIQQWVLPRVFPPFPERDDFELHAAMAPAKGVSGDLFDFFLLDDTHLGFSIGDVAGKGVAAALVAAVVRTLLRAKAQPGKPPGECVQQLHQALAEQQDETLSFSLIYGILDTKSGELQLCNHEHAGPYTFSPTRGAKLLENHDAPAFHTETVRLKRGDGVFLYTDGVTGARNQFGELFGSDRLAEYVSLHAAAPAEQMVLNLYTTLRFFSPLAAPADDITILALRYRG